jgi:hypothetical protein
VGVAQSATAKVGAPFKPAELAEFLAIVPDNADVMVSVHMEGQRDPYPRSFTFHAQWEGKA